MMDYFKFKDNTAPLVSNGDKETKEEEWKKEALGKSEATAYRGLAARLNYMSQDCPDLQFIIKDVSQHMANPTRGSWASMKKVVRYLLNREVVIWEFPWQKERDVRASLLTDSDWGGANKERKSTSGGVWMLGKHCVRTWSATPVSYTHLTLPTKA